MPPTARCASGAAPPSGSPCRHALSTDADSLVSSVNASAGRDWRWTKERSSAAADLTAALDRDREGLDVLRAHELRARALLVAHHVRADLVAAALERLDLHLEFLAAGRERGDPPARALELILELEHLLDAGEVQAELGCHPLDAAQALDVLVRVQPRALRRALRFDEATLLVHAQRLRVHLGKLGGDRDHEHAAIGRDLDPGGGTPPAAHCERLRPKVPAAVVERWRAVIANASAGSWKPPSSSDGAQSSRKQPRSRVAVEDLREVVHGGLLLGRQLVGQVEREAVVDVAAAGLPQPLRTLPAQALHAAGAGAGRDAQLLA